MRLATAGIALWASVAFASPAEKGYYYRSAEEMKDQPHPVSEMIFTGPITTGDPNITLSGTASSIYNQIVDLNPAYDSSFFDDPEGLATLAARQGNVDCTTGNYVERYYSQCAGAIGTLLSLGTSYCSVAPSTCARVSCSNSCSMYLCNNQFSQVNVYCRDIAADMGIIVGCCGTDNGNQDTRARGSISFSSHYTCLS